MNLNKSINDALVAHRKWKDRLRQAIENGTTELKPEIVKLDDQCAFGKWLHHEVTPEIKETASYQSVVQLHANFHVETARVLEMALRGRKSEAQQAMGSSSEWYRLTFALNSALVSWQNHDSSDPTSGHETISVDQMNKVLSERARALIKSTEMQTSETMQVVVFSLANETYGIATEFAKEVQPLRNITPVPCTPDFCVGVINIRGAIYSVIDIRGFFGVPKKAISDSTKVILVEAAGLEVGILADDVSGAASIPVSEIKPPLAAQSAAKEEYVQGVTHKMLIILNLEALLSDERIIVHQGVG